MPALRVTVCAVGLIASATVVFAQADWDWQTCNDDRDRAASISACTRLIDGGTLGDTGLATALYNRGVHLRNMHEIERAIADYSRAIQINTLHPRAYPSDLTLCDNRDPGSPFERAEATPPLDQPPPCWCADGTHWCGSTPDRARVWIAALGGPAPSVEKLSRSELATSLRVCPEFSAA
jgi:Tetratricopeptide repeat